MPPFEVKATASSLLEIYNQIDSAVDLFECAYMATFGPDVGDSAGDPLRAVLEAAKSRAVDAKATLHDMVGYVEKSDATP